MNPNNSQLSNKLTMPSTGVDKDPKTPEMASDCGNSTFMDAFVVPETLRELWIKGVTQDGTPFSFVIIFLSDGTFLFKSSEDLSIHYHLVVEPVGTGSVRIKLMRKDEASGVREVIFDCGPITLEDLGLNEGADRSDDPAAQRLMRSFFFDAFSVQPLETLCAQWWVSWPGLPDLFNAQQHARRLTISREHVVQAVAQQSGPPRIMASFESDGALVGVAFLIANDARARVEKLVEDTSGLAPGTFADELSQWLRRLIPAMGDGANYLTVDSSRFRDTMEATVRLFGEALISGVEDKELNAKARKFVDQVAQLLRQ